jgi:hypothetical protein
MRQRRITANDELMGDDTVFPLEGILAALESVLNTSADAPENRPRMASSLRTPDEQTIFSFMSNAIERDIPEPFVTTRIVDSENKVEIETPVHLPVDENEIFDPGGDHETLFQYEDVENSPGYLGVRGPPLHGICCSRPRVRRHVGQGLKEAEVTVFPAIFIPFIDGGSSGKTSGIRC